MTKYAKNFPQYLVRHSLHMYNRMMCSVHAKYRYCPEAEQLRQEQEEIQLRRRVREAVKAELAALAVPTAASRNGSFEQCENFLNQGCDSETGVHIVMERNFCLWRRHNCNRSLPVCADLLINEINY
jgi:hypothetical protein